MWNCNGLTESKLSNNDFVRLLTDNDILVLTESWTGKHFENCFCDFTAFNFYRKFRHRRAKRNSGGIVIFIRDSILPGVSVVRNHHDTIVWLKLDKIFFNFQTDIYLSCLYLWPDESPASKIIDVDLFDVLSDDVTYFEQHGSVLLAGDWNARVGNRLDYIACDINVNSLDGYEYRPDTPLRRASKDVICNTRGLRLIDMCKALSLRIANGRLGSDFNVGDFSYYSRQSQSTIDYLVLKESEFSLIHDFQVGSFTQYSDHAPLYFTISSCNAKRPSNRFDDNSSNCTFLRWDNEKLGLFRRELIARLPDFNLVVENCRRSDSNSIDSMINSFADIICSVSNPLFKHTVKTRSFTHSTNKDWFDAECINAQRIYKQALNSYNRDKSYESRQALCNLKQRYKSLIRKKKRSFIIKQSRNLETLKKRQPKEFWKFFSKQKQSTGTNISIQDFQNHFSRLFDDIRVNINEDAETFNEHSDFNINNPTFAELNAVITLEEVKSAIFRLKKNKASCPSDNLLNEYFINSFDILGGHITDIFNKVFDAGYFPQSWSMGYIVPIHKKGDKNVPNNYRGVTLLSNFGKLFTSVLTNRVETWFEENNLLSDAQFGFRKGSSTVDAIFVLNNLIQHYINTITRLPCAFIDLKKAFDSVERNALWLKLFNMGLDGKILVMFRSMYTVVKSCVKHCNTFSDFFNISVGLRQGQNNSPAFFALFIEDLEQYLQNRVDSGVEIFDLCLIILLFADDMVIIGKSTEDLQQNLNKLHGYCNLWGLEVNTSKTKVVVFRKRGPVRQDERWFYNNEVLEVVDNFNYLGVVFNYTGTFVLNNQFLTGKALKAMNVLFQNVKKLQVNPKLSLQLFDTFVGSTLSYASPVWGFSKSKDIERIHLRYCKMILGVSQKACNAAVYGELGRVPLYINRHVQIIKYWLKVINSENVILRTIYNNALVNNNVRGGTWPYKVKQLLDMYGFSNVWLNPYNIQISSFIQLFKQRITDAFRQEWFTNINNNRVLSTLYIYLKTSFSYEQYLSDIISWKTRQLITKIRISSNQLRINSGRYTDRLPRNERYCQICSLNTDIEDEYHFILKCECFQDLRVLYIKRYFYIRPNMFKFVQLLNSKNKTILLNLCKFVKQAIERRNHLIQNL